MPRTKKTQAGNRISRLPDLSDKEKILYSRHLLLPEIGPEGQKKLKNSRVLLVGAGALGSPLALYLAAAGVGILGIIDHDQVEASNLQRQILYREADIGRAKTTSAKERILALNPLINASTYDVRLSSANALELFSSYDVIVDGSDNFPTRYLVNDACALLGKPCVFGSVYRFEGQAAVFDAAGGACLRCLFPTPPPPAQVPSCGESGVLGVVPGIIGCIQAAETIKLIVGAGRVLRDSFLAFDALRMRFHEFSLHKRLDCPLCGQNPSIKELVDYEQFCRPEKYFSYEEAFETLSARELKNRLDSGANLRIIDVRLPGERNISRMPGADCISLPELLQKIEELNPAQDLVLVCRKGEKSADAACALRQEGYQGRLFNLVGGINAWAADIDPSLPQY
ncbi:MAG: ThiF family adenylyltransferase [Desulfovibrio sp.]|jgi:adenylyltransferase/sulfurtransferase|nr:ThiF family adenylyltransferase [Desulfovibrio sp.]